MRSSTERREQMRSPIRLCGLAPLDFARATGTSATAVSAAGQGQTSHGSEFKREGVMRNEGQ